MPTYEYECDACGHRFELFQSITDEPVKKCPDCGKSKARRLFGTGAAIMFKGSGFYQTDYRSESYKKGAKADNESSGSTTSGSKESKSSDSSAAANKSESTPPKRNSKKKSGDS
jgi:putative FmdB family regulatory protein